jgi:hypothetical protein
MGRPPPRKPVPNANHGAARREPTPPPPSDNDSDESGGDVVEVSAPAVGASAASANRRDDSQFTGSAAAHRARRMDNGDEDLGPVPKKNKVNQGKSYADDEGEFLSDEEVDCVVDGENVLLKSTSRDATPPGLTVLSTYGKFLTAGYALSNTLPQAVWMPSRVTSGHSVDAASHLTSSITAIVNEIAKFVKTAKSEGRGIRGFPGLTAKVNNAITLALAPLYQYQKIEQPFNLLHRTPTLPVVVITDPRYYHGFAVHGNWIYDPFNGSTYCTAISEDALVTLGYLVAVPPDDEGKSNEEGKKEDDEQEGDEVEKQKAKKIYVVSPDIVQFAVVTNKDWVDSKIKSDEKKKEDKAYFSGQRGPPNSQWHGGRGGGRGGSQQY